MSRKIWLLNQQYRPQQFVCNHKHASGYDYLQLHTQRPSHNFTTEKNELVKYEYSPSKHQFLPLDLDPDIMHTPLA